ncbi:MAG: hypothetical protein AMXMBFR75_21890 [Candidatus Hinthialibacteria bacterium]
MCFPGAMEDPGTIISGLPWVPGQSIYFPSHAGLMDEWQAIPCVLGSFIEE